MEKSLKAYLLARGWRLRRIHDLEALLDEAVEFDASWEAFRSLCQRANGYYLVGRYPLSAIATPSSEEVSRDLSEAELLVNRIRTELHSR